MMWFIKCKSFLIMCSLVVPAQSQPNNSTTASSNFTDTNTAPPTTISNQPSAAVPTDTNATNGTNLPQSTTSTTTITTTTATTTISATKAPIIHANITVNESGDPTNMGSIDLTCNMGNYHHVLMYKDAIEGSTIPRTLLANLTLTGGTVPRKTQIPDEATDWLDNHPHDADPDTINITKKGVQCSDNGTYSCTGVIFATGQVPEVKDIIKMYHVNVNDFLTLRVRFEKTTLEATRSGVTSQYECDAFGPKVSKWKWKASCKDVNHKITVRPFEYLNSPVRTDVYSVTNTTPGDLTGCGREVISKIFLKQPDVRFDMCNVTCFAEYFQGNQTVTAESGTWYTFIQKEFKDGKVGGQKYDGEQEFVRLFGLGLALAQVILSFLFISMCCNDPRERMNQKRKYRKFRRQRRQQLMNEALGQMSNLFEIPSYDEKSPASDTNNGHMEADSSYMMARERKAAIYTHAHSKHNHSTVKRRIVSPKEQSTEQTAAPSAMTGLTKLGGDTFRQAMAWTKQTENVENKSVAELPTRRSKHNGSSAQDSIEQYNDYTTIRQGSNDNSATANTPTMQPVIQSGSTWKRKIGASKFAQQVEDSTGSPNTANMEHSRYETAKEEKPRKATSKDKPRQSSKGMIVESDVNRHVMPFSTNTLPTPDSNIHRGSNETNAAANTPTMQPVIQSGSTWKRKIGAGKFVQQVEDSTGSPNTANMEHSRYETT